jgi:hypothetical protein
MTRKLIAALIATVIGMGISAQATAGDGNHRDGWRERHRDGRVDSRDKRHHGWEQGRHNGWRDRNHDGRVDWRDRRWRDRNHDGRVDWRDRRYHDHRGWRDRNHDGRVDWRDRRDRYWW